MVSGLCREASAAAASCSNAHLPPVQCHQATFCTHHSQPRHMHGPQTSSCSLLHIPPHTATARNQPALSEPLMASTEACPPLTTLDWCGPHPNTRHSSMPKLRARPACTAITHGVSWVSPMGVPVPAPAASSPAAAPLLHFLTLGATCCTCSWPLHTLMRAAAASQLLDAAGAFHDAAGTRLTRARPRGHGGSGAAPTRASGTHCLLSGRG
uniref:Uncharacterized protein n=1 Tax=Chlamydomonas leiostraca TaxID=1034604 RepID=A0A7S0S0E5_9CHLO|mmetsp:Transcript_36884/g.93110  ORF Transcript_36884/g.93110 Transcript_36884/m.93110 type:complete len:211 (+) Transcript_36884:277-909(+)